MKQESWSHPAIPPSSRRDTTESRRARADVALVAPKLTKLVTTKIIAPRPPATDPKTLERARLLSSLLLAKGRADVTRAAEAFFAAGHALDRRDQEPHLQLLEHADEGRVREAVAALADILSRDPVQHRPVLERRLSRIAETADERTTRDAADALRRRVF
jgi:hypothetical protein